MYTSSGSTTYPNARFGQGTGPIVFNNVYCTGSESNILDCLSDGYGVVGSCTHADDASITCSKGTVFIDYNEVSSLVYGLCIFVS